MSAIKKQICDLLGVQEKDVHQITKTYTIERHFFNCPEIKKLLNYASREHKESYHYIRAFDFNCGYVVKSDNDNDRGFDLYVDVTCENGLNRLIKVSDVIIKNTSQYRGVCMINRHIVFLDVYYPTNKESVEMLVKCGIKVI